LLFLQAFPSNQAQLEFAQQIVPLDPDLQEAYTLTDIGARVAICCGLHAVAAHAGLVAAGPTEELQANSTTDSWRREAEAAGVALWKQWLQARLCFAIHQ
jgi:hypothetical protein